LKKIFYAFVTFIILAFSASLLAETYWGGKTLSANEVKKKWGAKSYDVKKFRTGDLATKSKMAFSLMKDKNLIGKSYAEIIETFGQPEGFYFIDTYPAYIIQRGKDRSEDTWQLVFKIGDGYKVREIIMHRNCCDR
jgi:hypothetical protein